MTPLLAFTGIETVLIVTLISAGLSIAGAYLLAPDAPKEGLKDDVPSTTAVRGSYIPYVLNRRRVGAQIAYVGNRSTSQEDAGSSPTKGGSKRKKQKQTVYYEDAWHILCIGPAQRLHGIYQAGKPIFKTPGATPQTHPSGTKIDLGREGSFYIYWGDQNQPLGAEVNAAIGINSRWPFACYVFWEGKRLGLAPRWPILDYEVDVPLQSSHLANSSGNVVPTYVPGDTYGCYIVPSASPQTTELRILGSVATGLLGIPSRDEAPVGAKITVDADNDNDLDGLYTIHKYEVKNTTIPSAGGGPAIPAYLGVVTLEEPMELADTGPYIPNDFGNVVLKETVSEDGVNHAHMIGQVLWDLWPHGLGLDKQCFDLDFFEELGATLEDENVRGSYNAQGGATALTLIGHALQDAGAFFTWDVTSGKFRVKQIRPDANAAVIPEEILLGPLPEIATVHGRHANGTAKPTQLVFSFADRLLAYRAMTLVVGEDGVARREDREVSRKVNLPTINDITSASSVSERRAQEDLGQNAAFEIMLSREARQLVPGRTLSVHGIPFRLRLVSVVIDPYSGEVKLSVVRDYYGAKKSSWTWSKLEDEEEDIADSYSEEEFPPLGDITANTSGETAWSFVEIPGMLQPTPGVTLLAPRIRGTSQALAAAIWISTDGTTFRNVAVETNLQTGGVLTEALALETDWTLESGPTFDAYGPDIALVEDFSADEASWKAGLQLCLINDEIFFLRNVTALGGQSYRLEGLVRARYDSEREAHNVGALVRIFQIDNITPIEDLVIEPGASIYMKVQPIGTANDVPLSVLPTYNQTIIGKGVKPMKPSSLRTSNLRHTWTTGSDIHMKWGYRSQAFPGTGAGLQGAGNPTGCAEVQGVFVLEMRTEGGTLKQTYTTCNPFFTYYNEDLVADFDASEPSAIVVRLYHVHAGQQSDYAQEKFIKE